MEITVYVLFSLLTFLAFYIRHTRDDDVTPQRMVFGLWLGFFFIILGIMSMKLTYLIATGVNLTVYSFDAITNDWVRGLVILYLLMGFLEITLTIADALTFREKKKRSEMED